MKKEKFIHALKYLQACYQSTFKLDFKDEYALSVWYDILKDFNEEQFIETLKDYAKHNVYAPNSPAHLIDWEKQRVMKQIDTNGVCEEVIQTIRDYTYNLDQVKGYYIRQGKTAIAKTVGDLASDFEAWFKDTGQLKFLKKKWNDIYTLNFQNEIDAKVGKVSTDNLIGKDEVLKIG